MRQLLEFAWNLNDVFKIHVLPWRLGLSSVSAKQTSLSLKSSLTFTPERPAGGSKSQLQASVYPWVWTMHLSLQESTPFLTEIQPKTSCQEGVGSGFAIRCCASCWWWVLQAQWPAWQNPMCAPLLTHLPAHHLLLFFFIFPRTEEAPGGKYRESLLPDCPLLGSIGSVVHSQNQPGADPCQEVSSPRPGTAVMLSTGWAHPIPAGMLPGNGAWALVLAKHPEGDTLMHMCSQEQSEFMEHPGQLGC